MGLLHRLSVLRYEAGDSSIDYDNEDEEKLVEKENPSNKVDKIGIIQCKFYRLSYRHHRGWSAIFLKNLPNIFVVDFWCFRDPGSIGVGKVGGKTSLFKTDIAALAVYFGAVFQRLLVRDRFHSDSKLMNRD